MSRDSDGYFTFVGRADDVFKASDYRISPLNSRARWSSIRMWWSAPLCLHPDPIRTAIPKAFVILRNGVEPSRALALSIFRHIRQALAPYKRIRRIEFSDLPKTISGKIRRAVQTGRPKLFRWKRVSVRRWSTARRIFRSSADLIFAQLDRAWLLSRGSTFSFRAK